MRSSLTLGRALRGGEADACGAVGARLGISHRRGVGCRGGAPAARAAQTIRSGLLATVAWLGVLSLWCAVASANLVQPYVSSFGSFSNVQGIATDAAGNVYVYDAATGAVLKYDASGKPVNFTATGTNSISGVGSPLYGGPESEIAVDNSSGPAKGDIYIAFGQPGVKIYSAAGQPIGELNEQSGIPWGEPCGVAVDASGNVYIGIYQEHINAYVPAGGTVTNANYAATIGGVSEPCNLAVDSAGNVFAAKYAGGVTRYEASQFGSAAASGSVVDGQGSTLAVDPADDEVYVDEASQVARFGPHGVPFQSPLATFAESGPGAISGSYGIAVSGFNHDVYVSDGKGKVAIFERWRREAVLPMLKEEGISAVRSDSAILSAKVNPGEGETTYRVEYGSTAAYGASLPAPEGDVGDGTEDVSVAVHLPSLQQDTTYHARFVATNSLGTTYGADLTFHTQTGGGEFSLPDGRAYEMVSPPQKDGAQVLQTNNGGATVAASLAGDGLAYVASAPIGAEAKSNPTHTQVLARRGAHEWENRDISIPGEYEPRVGTGLGDMLFSSDLSLTVAQPYRLVAPIAEGVPGSLDADAYLHDTSSNVYQPLVTSAPDLTSNAVGFKEIKALGATPDLSHIALASSLPLTPNAQEALPLQPNIYEWSAGKLALVNVRPDGTATAGAGFGGELSSVTRHAISDDGSRIIWSAQEKLYVRDTTAEESVQVDKAQGGSESGGGRFQTASSDAKKIFFTDGRSLTSDAQGSDLYVFDVDSGTLTNVTPDSGDPLGAGVRIVLDAGEEGQEVYFVASGVLAQGGVAGKNNVYVARHTGSTWETTFVATLSEDDERGFREGDLVEMSARVSPNGRFLAFMSDAMLTGYDNRDANSGQPDEEVYLYDSQAGRLTCVSCNPSGARPVGAWESPRGEIMPMDPVNKWPERWLAATIPSWTPMTLVEAAYQSRYLSDSGRLFFGAADALVPQDSNGRQDVYEYEPAGVGDCVKQDGCVALISAGTGNSDAGFLDASSNGDDVFFMTADKLLRQDFDTAFDVYDARVCSQSHPCFPAQPASPPPCVTGDSCKAAPSPASEAFGAPASATFAGVGNVTVGSLAVKHKNGAAHHRHKRHKRHRHGRRRHARAHGSAAHSAARGVAR